MKVPKYGYSLEIINNETKENLAKSCMSNSMEVVIKELQDIVDELRFLYPKSEIGKKI